MSIDTFPVKRAIHHYLDSVSFSNPLPHWHDYQAVDYDSLVTILKQRMGDYLSARAEPSKVYRIKIPDVGGKTRQWVVPSVHDQIILETVVMVMAADISPGAQSPSYSFRYQDDENQFTYYEDNFAAWERFQLDTADQMQAAGGYLATIDLEQAFPLIDRARLFEFIAAKAEDQSAAELFMLLIEAFDPDGAGLPHINDSAFYVGNAYLSLADKVVAGVTSRFVRYMDNFHLFSASISDTRQLVNKVDSALSDAGFRLNHAKTRIVELDDYRWQVSDVRDGLDVHIQYLSAPIGGKMNASRLYQNIHAAISSPHEYITKSFGRHVMGVLRRARQANDENYKSYVTYLIADKSLDSENFALLPAALKLLEAYWAAGESEEWRALWILYVLFDFRNQNEVRVKLAELSNSGGLKSGKLWIKRIYSPMRHRPASDPTHKKNYLEEGLRLYGS